MSWFRRVGTSEGNVNNPFPPHRHTLKGSMMTYQHDLEQTPRRGDQGHLADGGGEGREELLRELNYISTCSQLYIIARDWFARKHPGEESLRMGGFLGALSYVGCSQHPAALRAV